MDGIVVVPAEYVKAKQTNPVKSFSRAVLTYNMDGETLESGSGNADSTIAFYNPFMNQGTLDNLVATLNGFSYTPMNLDWRGRVYLETGDPVKVREKSGNAFFSRILTTNMNFQGGLLEKTKAPSASAQQSEFDYAGGINKIIKSVASGGLLKEDEPYFGVTIGRANGLKIERSDGNSQVILNSDYLKWQVKVAGEMIDRLYFDAEAGDLKYNGKFGVDAIEALKADINIIVNNTFVTNTLTAQKGYIAELTVDQLDSSDKVARYKMLTANPLRKAPVGFIRIYDQHVDFIDAQYIGDIEGVEQREQATTRNGDPVYWLDETMTGITEDVTDYPVWQLKYTEWVKLQIFHRYDSETGYYNPLIRLGAGNGVGDNATAEIEKKSDGLYLTYTATGAGSVSAGETVSLVLGDDGAIINGLTYLLDALNIASDSFQATYGSVVYDASVTKDVDGRITAITTDGKTIPITYNEVP